MTELLALPAPSTVPATPDDSETTEAESGLPKQYHDAYRMKLAGKSVQEIADSFSVDRTTIWRWTRAYAEEALQKISNEPVFNLIVKEVLCLNDIEEQAREGAEQTKSDRARAMFLAESRRAAVSRQNLLVKVGIFPKQPEQIFRLTATMRPVGQAAGEERKPRSREEAIEWLIQKLQKARPDI